MKLLALAYYYPPSADSGTHRSLHLLNRLAAWGEEITVITARQADYALGAPVDPQLAARIDPRIRTVRVPVRRPLYSLVRARALLRRQAPPMRPQDSRGAGRSGLPGLARIKDAVSGMLTYPDDHVGWIPGALRAAAAAIRSGAIDRIYSSGGPWSSHLAAALLKQRFRIPLVLDFRDPWASNPDRRERSRAARLLDLRLESLCISLADRVVANTEPLRQDFLERYPHEAPGKFTTITNGFEPLASGAARARSQRFTLVHAGTIYPPRDPSCLLLAARDAIREGQIRAEDLLIRFVGEFPGRVRLAALLECCELKHAVEIMPQVAHTAALEMQREADVLVLFQNAFPLQVPRKLYEYMSLLKPVLAIAPSGGATAAIVEESGVGIVTGESAGAIKSALLQLYAQWRSGAAGIGASRLDRYRNDRLAGVLRSVLAQPLPPPSGRPADVPHA
ncbi:MAG: glycosyltransferase [Gammaproteobacteria bacterium]|nr:glycosyltransferase [Gammaproteobacteria bacterium]